MTSDEIRRTLHEILTEHDRVIEAIRASNEEMRASNEAMRASTDHMREAISRHDTAIVAALLANRAAIALLNRWNDEGVQP